MSEPQTDAEYEAQWDANTLARAAEIKADPTRFAAAKKRAREMAKEAVDLVDSLDDDGPSSGRGLGHSVRG